MCQQTNQEKQNKQHLQAPEFLALESRAMSYCRRLLRWSRHEM
jgi:hypothetical protein